MSITMNFNDFNMIKSIHVSSLYKEKEKWISYKNISINQVMSEICFDGDWFQFGVYKGQTARILESFILGDQKLHLFEVLMGFQKIGGIQSLIKAHLRSVQMIFPDLTHLEPKFTRGGFPKRYRFS